MWLLHYDLPEASGYGQWYCVPARRSGGELWAGFRSRTHETSLPHLWSVHVAGQQTLIPSDIDDRYAAERVNNLLPQRRRRVRRKPGIFEENQKANIPKRLDWWCFEFCFPKNILSFLCVSPCPLPSPLRKNVLRFQPPLRLCGDCFLFSICLRE